MAGSAFPAVHSGNKCPRCRTSDLFSHHGPQPTIRHPKWAGRVRRLRAQWPRFLYLYGGSDCYLIHLNRNSIILFDNPAPRLYVSSYYWHHQRSNKSGRHHYRDYPNRTAIAVCPKPNQTTTSSSASTRTSGYCTKRWANLPTITKTAFVSWKEKPTAG